MATELTILGLVEAILGAAFLAVRGLVLFPYQADQPRNFARIARTQSGRGCCDRRGSFGANQFRFYVARNKSDEPAELNVRDPPGAHPVIDRPIGDLVPGSHVVFRPKLITTSSCCLTLHITRGIVSTTVDRPFRDLRGARFGKLTITGYGGTDWPYKRRQWIVQCDCGSKPRVVFAANLLSGRTRSCGCAPRRTADETPPTAAQRYRAEARGYAALARLYESFPGLERLTEGMQHTNPPSQQRSSDA
jgi:hypothetical protein